MSNYDAEKIAAMQAARKAYRQKLMMSTLAIILLCIMLILFTVFATGQFAEQRGMFEIISKNLGDGQISLSNYKDFSEPTVMLYSKPIENMYNISEMRDLPQGIEDTDGPHNGKDYFAHTFYLRNTGGIEIDVEERIDITGVFKNADKAIRVKVYRNGISATYAAPSASGEPEYGTIAFLDEEKVYSNVIEKLKPGETVKYTVVIWLEGDDPECKDDIMGGFIRFSMHFNVINGSDKQADDKN